MSSTKRFDWVQYTLIGMMFAALLLLSVGIIDRAYHHYLEERARPASKGWSPPKIVKYENCALWDEIRKECEDD